MFQASPPHPETTEPPDPAQARRQHELAGLEELADLALELCREFQSAAIETRRTAQTPQDMTAAQGYARAFDRTARTYRQCLALRDRLVNGDTRQTKAQAQAAPFLQVETLPVVTAQQVAQRRIDVGEALRACVYAADRTPVEREQLLADIEEFLGDEESLRWGGVSDILWRQCIVLGLPFDLDRWAHTAWAQDEIATQPRGSLYEGYREPQDQRPP
ncbi:MAG TPA: hypothetical protein VF459_17870 [Caulobacteraceae bacterium]